MNGAVDRRTVLLGAAGGLAAAAGLAGCGSTPTGPPSTIPTAGSTRTSGTARSSSTSPSPSPSPTPSATRAPDPAKVKANELGVVPVMMYHRLTDQPGEYDMTPGAFRAQVRRLLHAGYRPVDARDLARGRIDVPAGKTPVVLTFDDGSANQFRLRADGRLDPRCSAGILASECAKVPGAVARATFYVNRAPFGLTDRKDQARTLRALLAMGFQLGNHTLDHADLATLSGAAVAKEFVRLQRLVEAVAPKADLSTMALPFGVDPRDHALARKGAWDHTSYRFDLTLLVGANPAPSPFDDDFDPHDVPRIRGTSWHGGTTPLTGTYWLDQLDAHPSRRYVSAGNPDHVTVPKALKHRVAAKYHDRLITY